MKKNKTLKIIILSVILVFLLFIIALKYFDYKLSKYVSTDWEPIKTEKLEKNIPIEKKYFVDSIREGSRKIDDISNKELLKQ